MLFHQALYLYLAGMLTGNWIKPLIGTNLGVVRSSLLENGVVSVFRYIFECHLKRYLAARNSGVFCHLLSKWDQNQPFTPQTARRRASPTCLNEGPPGIFDKKSISALSETNHTLNSCQYRSGQSDRQNLHLNVTCWDTELSILMPILSTTCHWDCRLSEFAILFVNESYKILEFQNKSVVAYNMECWYSCLRDS